MGTTLNPKSATHNDTFVFPYSGLGRRRELGLKTVVKAIHSQLYVVYLIILFISVESSYT